MRIYEELFIVKPDAPEEEVDAYIGQVQDLIAKGNGTVDKTDKWGTRKLAYKVQKYSEGIYVLIQFTSTPELVREVERRMRVTDLVIKFITVRIDEKMKKIEKRKKQRDKRAARKPAPAPMAPAMVSPAMPASLPRRPLDCRLLPRLPHRRPQLPQPPRRRPRLSPRASKREDQENYHGGTKRRATDFGVHASHRRRQSHRRKETVFPSQEAVPLLRGQNRRHQLQRRAPAAELYQ